MEYEREWCPHTATAAEVYRRLSTAERRDRPWVLVATAHPAKFREIVEPLIGATLTMPQNLARLFDRPSSCIEIEATLGALSSSL